MGTTNLHCIIDCSGSMTEYGKPMLMVNLLRFIRQFAARQDKKVHFFSWRTEIQLLNWSALEDVALAKSSGNSSVTALCSWCKNNPTAEIIVLTDGYFDLNKEQRSLLNQSSNLHFIAVGGDADISILKAITINSYPAEQIEFAFFSIDQTKGFITPPVKRVDLLAAHQNNNLDEDDDWD